MVGEPEDVDVAYLEWSAEIVAHIARHFVEREDVEAVLASSPLFFRNLPNRPATHVMVGRDGKGRTLYIPIVCLDWPDRWMVISAWESRLARGIYARRKVGRDDE